MLETDKAWAAGIIDGEGSIMILNNHNSYVLRVRVGNTDLKMLDKLQTLFGGKIHVEKDARPNRKQAWCWQVNGQQAENVLLLVQEFLVTKKERAEIGLLVRKFTRKQGRHGVHPHQAQMVSLYEHMRTLNKRGTLDLQ